MLEVGGNRFDLKPENKVCFFIYSSNSHDYTTALPCYESINSETKRRKSFILPTLSWYVQLNTPQQGV